MKYKKPKWAVKQIERQSGLIEDICEHGVGHPNDDYLDKHPNMVKKGFGIHGCDGCCNKKTKDRLKASEKKMLKTLELASKVVIKEDMKLLKELVKK